MKKKECFFIFLSGVLVELILFLARIYLDYTEVVACGFLLYSIITASAFLIFKNTKPWLVIFMLMLAPLIIQLPLRVTRFQTTLVSLDSYLLNFCAILFTGLVFAFNKLQYKWISAVTGVFIGLYMILVGSSSWNHKLNYGSFTGRVSFPNTNYDFSVKNREGDIYSNEILKDKIVLLDFWHTSCGHCFEQFPLLEQISKAYLDNDSILVIAVNIPLKSDSNNQAFDTIQKLGYSFDTLVAIQNELANDFYVQVYPTTILLNKSGDIVFSGSLENANRIIRAML